jgi:threonine aldolase
MIDLRSDTVTKPTTAMRRAMAEAEVGDDVYAEDPTVNRLERRAAELLGKEAALFVPTGSMGNSIAIKLHTHHGEEVVCDHRAHILDWELGMPAWFSGAILRTIPTVKGLLSWKEVESAIRPRGGLHAATSLVEIENTHNMGGGTVYPVSVIDEICEGAHGRGLKVHMDGARIFNAAEASGESVARIARGVDSVMFCLSKALGAPIGSVLCASAADIVHARHYRKCLGGGMRQVGVLAAAGLVALDETPPRLSEDHANARLLAEKAARLSLDVVPVETNIVIFDIAKTGLTTAELAARLKQRGVLASGVGGTRFRMVTHYDVSRADCERAALALAESL